MGRDSCVSARCDFARGAVVNNLLSSSASSANSSVVGFDLSFIRNYDNVS